MKSKTFKVEGMSCASCQASVENIVSKIKGVNKASVNLLAKTLDVKFEGKDITEGIIRSIEKIGFKAEVLDSDTISYENFDNKNEIESLYKRFILSLIFSLPLFLLAMTSMILPIFNLTVPLILDHMNYPREHENLLVNLWVLD